MVRINPLIKNIPVIFLIIFGFDNAHAFEDFPKGLAFELGAGHNQLFWKYSAGSYWDYARDKYIEYPAGSRNRTALSISPTIRTIYYIQLHQNIYLSPFIGFDRFGGRMNEDANGYRDGIWWNTIELGSILSYNFRKYRFGCGIKVNRNIAVIHKYHSWSFHYPPGDSAKIIGQENLINELPKYSYDLGIRTGWGYKHFYYFIESWFGLGNLVKGSFFDEDGGVKVRENHFRLMIGYRL